MRRSVDGSWSANAQRWKKPSSCVGDRALEDPARRVEAFSQLLVAEVAELDELAPGRAWGRRVRAVLGVEVVDEQQRQRVVGACVDASECVRQPAAAFAHRVWVIGPCRRGRRSSR
jgi:hypothetical protein